MVCNCPAGTRYCKREAHLSPLWRILVDHRENFLRQYERRYSNTHGPLPRGTEEALEKLLRCGDPNYGLALLHCADCKIHFAVPFSCKQRACPSCANRRAEDLSHLLCEQLPEVTYRHVVVTFPRKMGLRKRFQQNPRLYRQTSRLIHRLLSRWMPKQVVGCEPTTGRALPGIIMATQSFGAGLKIHPHFHILVSDGVFTPGESPEFLPMGHWDTRMLTETVREAVLRSLVARNCLRQDTAKVMRSWPIERSGFSVFAGDPLRLPEDRAQVQRVLRYIFRSSLPLSRLSYQETTAKVQYRDPSGQVKQWEHAFDFLADFIQHIPLARQHTVTYAGHFANALGNLTPEVEETTSAETPKPAKTRRTRWAALVLRTWAVDPELCPRCGQTMRRSKTLCEQQEVRRLLESLGIGAYPTRPRSPPPPDDDDNLDQTFGWSPESDTQVPPGWDNWDAA